MSDTYRNYSLLASGKEWGPSFDEQKLGTPNMLTRKEDVKPMDGLHS